MKLSDQAETAVKLFLNMTKSQRVHRMVVWVPNENPNKVRDYLLTAFKKKGAEKAFNAGTHGDIVIQKGKLRYFVIFTTKKQFTSRGGRDCIVKMGN